VQGAETTHCYPKAERGRARQSEAGLGIQGAALDARNFTATHTRGRREKEQGKVAGFLEAVKAVQCSGLGSQKAEQIKVNLSP
jgi:hypothetical protein